MSIWSAGVDWVERGWMPDWLTRMAIRRLCGVRLQECAAADCESERESLEQFLREMRAGPIAPVPERANEQHYEVPAEFFDLVLGPHRKYSCCFWSDDTLTLGHAEENALELTCRRAELDNGQDVLELGCGWGSLSLWMATRYPRSRITAVSNSRPQRKWIEAEARQRGLRNLRVITRDMNDFDADATFDRVVSVEMFEHMRNYDLLLSKIRRWLRPDGRLFVHIFCHRKYAYPFESEGDQNWMGKYFFTGGIMPSDDLLARFARDMRVERQWRWNGRHYQKTADAWLAYLDSRRDKVMPILASAYGRANADRWLQRWRMFFMAVSELFGFADGQEWFVGHYLLMPQRQESASPVVSPLGPDSLVAG